MSVQESQQEPGALHPAGVSPVKPGGLFCKASKTSSFALATKSPFMVTAINAGRGHPEPRMLLPHLAFLPVPGRPPAPQDGLAVRDRLPCGGTQGPAD